MYYLGLSTMGSSSAALFKDGSLIFAIEEERLTRIKNDGSFPIYSIQECLDFASIDINDISAICIYWKPWKVITRFKGVIKKLFSTLTYNKSILKIIISSLLRKSNSSYPELKGRWLDLFRIRSIINKNFDNYKGKIVFCDHHLTHQFYAESINEDIDSVSISYDGGGEEYSTIVSVNNMGNKKIVKKIKWPNSLGHFYSFFTGYLGFRMLEGEYKMMGLAPLGSPIYKDLIYKKIIKLNKDKGDYSFNYNLCDYHSALEGKFNPKLFNNFIKPRKKNEALTQKHKDLAASIQEVFEEVLENTLSWIKKNYPDYDELVLSGGCALNVSANGKIIQKSIFKNITLPPAPHDAGCSVGSVLSYLKDNNLKIDYESVRNPYLGTEFSNDDIKKIFQKMNLTIPTFYNDIELADKTARKIADKGIVAWFQGRSEFGPRALGSRSFLADPRNDSIREEINKKIKKRELFRPFAPSILFENQSEYFDLSKCSPYMNIVSNVKKTKQPLIPAVVHTDNTSRVHSVIKKLNPKYHLLISKFYEITGIPVLLNTSFNIQEPIVNSPKDAIKTFFDSDVDLLVIGNYFCDKEWKLKQIK